MKGTQDFETKLPECLGIGTSSVFFCSIMCLYAFCKITKQQETSLIIVTVLCYIVFGTLLGFIDDVLELRWRDKLIFPFFFSLLIIFDYQGSTMVQFPQVLINLIGIKGIELSYLFYVYLVCLSIFCFNSINIYSGIMGLESGQSLFIGMTLMIENMLCIIYNDSPNENFQSLLILGPFVSVSMAMLMWNKVDRKTFVGDTYCYFAGCVLAGCAIIGKQPIKIMLFFLPQLFNFILSLPQLFGYVFCPRHRLPELDQKTKLMRTTYPKNLNLVNFALKVLGPLHEQELGDYLLALQAYLNLGVIVLIRVINFL